MRTGLGAEPGRGGGPVRPMLVAVAVGVLATGSVLRASAQDEPSQQEPGGAADPEPDPAVNEPSAFELRTGFGMLSRSLSWNDGDLVGRGMAGYRMGAAPVVRARAVWYPGVHVAREGLPTVFGLALQFEHSVAAKSESLGGSNVQYPTRSRQGSAALRTRGVFGPVNLWLDLGFGAQAFVLDAVEAAPAPNVPDVQYRYLAAEAGLEYVLPSLRLGLTVGYRHLLHVGELGMATWFPRLQGGGVHAGLELAYLLPKGIEVGFDLRGSWYMFDLRPEPGDPIWTERGAVAGGATDRYLSLLLQVGWRY
jgi:hypothetical protein